jgi:hypothetical protein
VLYDLRHTFATRMIEAGVSEFALGHSRAQFDTSALPIRAPTRNTRMRQWPCTMLSTRRGKRGSFNERRGANRSKRSQKKRGEPVRMEFFAHVLRH